MSFISFLDKLDQDAKGTLGVDEGNQIQVVSPQQIHVPETATFGFPGDLSEASEHDVTAEDDSLGMPFGEIQCETAFAAPHIQFNGHHMWYKIPVLCKNRSDCKIR